MLDEMLHDAHEGQSWTQENLDGPIYLDNQATTPVDPRVAYVVFQAMTKNFGNPNNTDHYYGEAASHLLQDSKGFVAQIVGAELEHVRFTSGATEAVRIAFAVACANVAPNALHVALCRTEHRAVLDVVASLAASGRAVVHWIEVDAQGRVGLNDVDVALAQGVDLLCLMAANNEVGTIHPVREAARLAYDAGTEILVDATQAAGRSELQAVKWAIDYLILSAHKLYGPKGVGALVGPKALGPVADAVCGHQGTPNVPGVAGFGAACRIMALEGSINEARVANLRDRLESILLSNVPGLVVNGDRTRRLTNNLHVSAPGAPNDAVLVRLRQQVAIATGAACTSGAQDPSHVLRAMGLPESLKDSALRISPGWFNTPAEIERAGADIVNSILSVRMAMGRFA